MTTIPVTLLILPEVDDPAIGTHGERVVYVTDRCLDDRIREVLDDGAVVGVAATDESATRLLRLGADEVLRPGADPELVEAAMARARLRARGRWARSADQTSSLSDLVQRVVDDELVDAAMHCQMLQLGLGPVMRLADEYVRSAAAGSSEVPASELGRVIAQRVAAPSSESMSRAAAQITSTLKAVADAVHHASMLAPTADEPAICDAAAVVIALTTLARNLVGRRAYFDVKVPTRACPVAISRSRLTNIVADVLRRAVDAVERSEGDSSRITISVIDSDEFVVVTSEDNGAPRTVDDDDETRCVAARYARQAGGGIMVDEELGVGTTVRVFLPRPSSPPSRLRQ